MSTKSSAFAENGRAQTPVASPYADAKRAYIDRISEHVLTAISARRIAAMLATALCLSLLANVVLATTAKFVPVYVHDNAQGQITYVGRGPETNDAPSQASVRAQLADWLSNVREVSSDPMATRERQRRVAAFVMNGSQAQSFLKSFYLRSDPLTMGFQKRIAVAVNFVSAIGASTREYEGEWTEDTRDSDGRRIGAPKRFRGRFTIALARPIDEAGIYANPLGLFITDLNWAEKIN